jgi:hypothetical protein
MPSRKKSRHSRKSRGGATSSKRSSRSPNRSASLSKKGVPKQSSECPPGQMLRKGYIRKAYDKVESDGKTVHVSAQKIPPVCIDIVGKPVRAKKLLPKLPEEEKGKLRKEGYSLSASKSTRHKALENAVKKHGYNDIIWHLNYMRNISAYEKNKDKFEEDMKFVQGLKRSSKQGGDDDDDDNYSNVDNSDEYHENFDDMDNIFNDYGGGKEYHNKHESLTNMTKDYLQSIEDY